MAGSVVSSGKPSCGTHCFPSLARAPSTRLSTSTSKQYCSCCSSMIRDTPPQAQLLVSCPPCPSQEWTRRRHCVPLSSSPETSSAQNARTLSHSDGKQYGFPH